MTQIDRRRWLAGGLMTFGAGLAGGGAGAQVATGLRPIDFHHHWCSPQMTAWLKANGREFPAGPLGAAESLEKMDRDGVAAAVTSSLWFGEHAEARRVVRSYNEWAAGQVATRPARLGMFAALPMPDVDGCLAETVHALDNLGADGVSMFTSYGDRWIGDPVFAPLFEELNRRDALVYVHPHRPDCCETVPGLRPSIIEYGTDTTRAIASMLFGGATHRYPRVRMIFSHGGGTMPFLIGRFIGQAAAPGMAEILPNGAEAALKGFYYEIAQTVLRPPLLALAEVIPATRLLFGSDYPFRSGAQTLAGLRAAGVFTERDLEAICSGNGEALQPRFSRR